MSTETLCEELLAAQPESGYDELFSRLTDSVETIPYLLSTARSALGTDPGSAARRALLASSVAEHRTDLLLEAQSWRVVGQAYRAAGRHGDAVAALETGAARAERAGDPLLAAQCGIGRIDSLGFIGRHREAVALARRLEAEFRRLGSAADAAKVLVNLGSLYYRRDRYDAALSCYTRAQQALTVAGDPVAAAHVQGNIANILMELNRADEALALFESARDAFAAADQTTATVIVDANIGYLHYLSGRYGASIAALDRGRSEAAAHGQLLLAAKFEADMAEAYRELNAYPEAIAAYESAIAHFSGASVDYERARAEVGRSAMLMAQARPEEALAGLDRAEAVFRDHTNSVRIAHVRLVRAYILNGAGRTDEAEEQARSAAATFARRKLTGWAAEARYLIAQAGLLTGGAHLKSMHAISRTARLHGRGWLEARAENSLGRYYASHGRRARALRHFQAGVQAVERVRTLIAPEEMHVSFLRDKLDVYENIVGVLLARGSGADVSEALQYVERAKSRLLLDRIQSALEGRISRVPASPELEARLAALRAELNREYHGLHAADEGEARRLGVPQGTDSEALAALERRYRSALQEADLRGNSESASLSLTDVVSPAALQGQLQPDEALIEYYVVHDRICAFVVTGTSISVVRDIASMEAVRYNARRLRFQLQRVSAGEEGSKRHAQRYLADAVDVLGALYDQLIRPIERVLTVERLVVVPYGALHGLPFHALHDGERYALDRWEIAYAPSAALWYQGEQANESAGRGAARNGAEPCTTVDRVLVVGVADCGIENVSQEVELLAAMAPGACIVSGAEATLAAFHLHASEADLIHIATHALFRSDNPLFSGLRLSDGWLLARDLYGMTLKCGLATLSGCETGMASVEAGDELFGLQRGFLAAGARSVAASLWLADDAATAALMGRFYAAMADGLGKAAALRLAQQETRILRPHPYHWAAFVLIGGR